jgi:glycine cleavage system H protein
MKVYYTKTDEYAIVDGDVATVGITNYASEHLGDIIFVDKIPSGKKVKKESVLTSIESVKAATDVFSPVSGEIIEFNEEVGKNPGSVNQGAESTGWIAKIKLSDPGELASLLDAESYSKIHS